MDNFHFRYIDTNPYQFGFFVEIEYSKIKSVLIRMKDYLVLMI